MPPQVYLFHGEDEYSISQEIEKLEKKVGDGGIASLNITHLDGRTLTFEELENAARAAPFLASRRLVVLDRPLAKFDNNPALREKFLALLDSLPESTALVLVECQSGEDARKKSDEKRKLDWLLEWVKQAGKQRALVRHFPRPDMTGWIREQAKREGGEFTHQAALVLASLVGEDTRLAGQEIAKLLAYVNYRRPVEADDVEQVVTTTAQGDIFKLVDALGMQDGNQAMRLLTNLLDKMDAQHIFSMILRQFRLLLQTREMLDSSRTLDEITKTLKLPGFAGKKMFDQAQRFSLVDLEAIYRRLLEVDESIKTGRVEPELAMEAFIAGFAMQSLKHSLI